MVPEILEVVEKTLSIKTISSTINTVTNQELKWNFENKDFEYDQNREPIKLTQRNEILIQWVKRCFHTHKDKYRTYYKDRKPFGLYIKDYIGQNPYAEDFTLLYIKKEIITILKTHEWIKSVTNYKSEFKRNALYIEFTIIYINENGKSEKAEISENI